MSDKGGILDWALPVMRAGYAGRAVTYAAVAGVSLWAIWGGGSAEGTDSAMQTLSESTLGRAVVLAAVVGLIAYAIWRLIDAAFDLEEQGTDGKGLIARGGMIVTGLVHGALGIGFATALGGGSGSGSGGGSGGVTGAVSTVLSWPGGRWIVMIAGALTLCAAVYYAHKAWKASYRSKLFANEVTRRWNGVLRVGVAAQAVVVGVAGGLLLVAGLNGDPEQAGGMGAVFEFLRDQPFGQILVIVLCAGLLAFALFCLVNAAYRIIPALHDGDGPETLGDAIRAQAA